MRFPSALALLLALTAPPAQAAGSEAPAASAPDGAADTEPTREECQAAVDKAQALADTLPANHASRYIAERHLHQALAEAGNGEFDDCLEWAERAIEEIRERRHSANDKIEVLQPNQLPAR